MRNRITRRLIIGFLLAQLTGTTGCQATRSMLAWTTPVTPQQQQQEQYYANKQIPNEDTKSLTRQQKVNVQLAMARSLEKQNKQQEAISVYEDILKRENQNAEACHRLAVLHDLQGKSEKAAEYYQRALKQNPKSAEIYCDLGYSFYLQRRWAESEQNLRHAIELKHDFVRAHNNLGLMLARSGKSPEALWEFHNAGMDEPEARCNLALALMLENRWDEAESQCQAARNVGRGSPQTRDKLTHFSSIIAQARTTHSTATARTTTDVRTGDPSVPQQVAFNSPAQPDTMTVSPQVEARSAPPVTARQASLVAPAMPAAASSTPVSEGPSEASEQSPSPMLVPSPLQDGAVESAAKSAAGTPPQVGYSATIGRPLQSELDGRATSDVPTPAAGQPQQATYALVAPDGANASAQSEIQVKIAPDANKSSLVLRTSPQSDE